MALSQRRTARCRGGPFAHAWKLVLALLLQAQDGAAARRQLSHGILDLLARSTSGREVVLLILALFSIVSWGIFLYKWWTFRRAQRQSAQFLDVFRRSNKFSEVQAVCRSLSDSPLVGLFQAGYAELTTQLRQTPARPHGADPIRAARRVQL